VSDTLAVTNSTEARPVVESEAGGVLGEDARLHRPYPGPVDGLEEGVKECGADAVPASMVRDIDRVLDHAPVHLAR